MEQFSIKDEQIKNLQSSPSQSQQPQAMTEKECETESRELIEINVTNLWLVGHKRLAPTMIELGVDFRVDPTQKNKWKIPISKLVMHGQKNIVRYS